MKTRALIAGLGLTLITALLVGCPDGGEEGTDAGTASDAGGGSDSGGGSDAGATDQYTPPPDAAQADGAQPDSAVVFAQEVTLGYDDGLPALKLVGEANTEGRLLVNPDPSLRPVEVRKIRFIPVSANTATLRIATDQLGGPGATLATREFTTTSGDLDQWYEIDISDLAVQVDGSFWVVLVNPASFTEPTEVSYGGTSSSGQTYYYNAGYLPYTVNFDQLMRVVVGTPSTTPVDTPGTDGADCDKALDCESGACSGGRCTIPCSGGDCGAGRHCRTFASGEGYCVTTCSTSSECAASAFCLTDTTFLDPAGFCVRGGPYGDGADCQYHYHTICQHGLCSACASDPTLCEDPGTCGSAP